MSGPFFDGREYHDGSFVTPYEYHPRAPMTGIALSKALAVAYYGAQEHARIVFQQSYSWDRVGLGTPLGTTNAVDFIRIAEGFAVVPKYATHFVASIVFRHVAGTKGVAHHRIKYEPRAFVGGGGGVYGGSSGQQTDTDIPAQAPADFVNIDDAGVYVARCELEIEATTPFRGDVWVEGYSEAEGLEFFPGHLYYPLHVSCWWELRQPTF